MVYCEGIEGLLSVAGLGCEGRSVCLLYDLGQGPGGGWSRPERHLHGSRDWALHHDLSPRLPLLQTWPGEGMGVYSNKKSLSRLGSERTKNKK